jgi:coenzyme F420-reducing hydrogenase beta subunit
MNIFVGLSMVVLCLTTQPSTAFTSTNNRGHRERPTRCHAQATPIDISGWPDKFPAKDHCSKCGLCETSFVSKVTDACAFLGEGMARMDKLEGTIHGRTRDLSGMVWSDPDSKDVSGVADEARFGVLHEPVMLAKGLGIKGAQWTGCVTGIALSMLESGMVDAVVCIANQPGGEWSASEPILAKTPEDVLRGRGVKPALAPSLRVLDQIRADTSVKKLLFCGVGCAVQGA